MSESKSPNEEQDRGRDAGTLRVMGVFFTVLALLVLAGTFWSLDNSRAIVVTLVCGAVLLCVGVGTSLVGWKNNGN